MGEGIQRYRLLSFFLILYIFLPHSNLEARSRKKCYQAVEKLAPKSRIPFSVDDKYFSMRSIADGLWIPKQNEPLSIATEDEINTSINFGFYLDSVHKQSMLLLPDYLGFSIPAFDGVIFNSEGKAIYNLQLKHVSFNGALKAFTTAVKKINRFQTDNKFWQIISSPIENPRHWLSTVKYVLGLDKRVAQRKSQIVIKLKSYDSERALDELTDVIQHEFHRWPPAIHSVILMTSDRLISIDAEHIETTFWTDID